MLGCSGSSGLDIAPGRSTRSGTVPARLGVGTQGWYPGDSEVAMLGVSERASIARATRRVSFDERPCGPESPGAPGRRQAFQAPLSCTCEGCAGGAGAQLVVRGVVFAECLASRHAPDNGASLVSCLVKL